MLKLFRYWLFVVISLTLTACGGGGSLENGGDDEVDDSTYTLTLSGMDTQGEASRITQQDNPLIILAQLSQDGEPAANEIITFNTPVGILEPSAGNVLTDSNGVAEITLQPGNQANSGKVTATFSTDDEDITASYTVQSLGDGEDDSAIDTGFSINAQGYICDSSNLTQVSEIEQCTPNTQINQTTPLYFIATVISKASQQPVANKLISASVGTGSLLPENGNAISDSNGKAVFKIYSDGATGADEITINYDTASENFVYQVNTTEVTPTHGYVLTAELTEYNNTDVQITEISRNQPGKIKIELTLDNEPVEQKIVSVTTDVGELKSSTGNVLTDNNGQALLVIGAGNVADKGEITVTTQIISGTRTINLEDKIAFSSVGDDVAQAPSDNTLSLKLYAADEVTQINQISDENPGVLVAELLDSSGAGIADQVINFTTSLGDIFPALGTALTDAEGQAKVELTAGDTKGAGTATVSYNDASASVSFNSEGDANIEQEQYDISISFLDCNAENANPFNSNSCVASNEISLTNPGTARIKITRAGSQTPINNTLITASVDAGSLSPTNGRVITNDDGLAVFTILASDADGAGELTVNANGTEKTSPFLINPVDIAMGRGSEDTFEKGLIKTNLAEGEKLAVGNTAVLTINVVNASENNVFYNNSVSINLSSSCVEQGKAIIDSPVTAINGVAKAVYRVDGCREDTDIIEAQASVGISSLTANAEIEIAQVAPASIEFVDASVNGDNTARRISYPGSGQPEQADITFKVLGEDGNPLDTQTVSFSLTAQGAGITVNPQTAVSNANGLVTVSVKAGRTPTPVRVVAELLDSDDNAYSPQIQAVSDFLIVSTGLADQNSVSLAVETFNIEAWEVDGVNNAITMRLADHFNNPVPNGTAVNFTTSGGSIESDCITENGVCSVNWVSQSPKLQFTNITNGMCDIGNDNDPANDVASEGVPCFGLDGNGNLGPLQLARPRSGRAQVLGYAIGEESFVDSNGNGQYDAGEKFGDLDEAFLDHNEDNQFCGRLADGTAAPGALPVGDSSCLDGGDNDEPVDFNKNSTYDIGNGQFDGILCVDGNNCTQDFVHVRDTGTVILSGSNAFFNLRDNAGNSVTLVNLTTASGQPAVSFTAYITDINNNPMPAGTTVSLSIDNGEISGSSSYDYPNTATSIPQGFSFTLKQESDLNGTSSGIGTITVTSPLGVVSSYQFSIVDDG